MMKSLSKAFINLINLFPLFYADSYQLYTLFFWCTACVTLFLVKGSGWQYLASFLEGIWLLEVLRKHMKYVL